MRKQPIVFAVLLAALCCSAAHASAETEHKKERTLTVQGQGRIFVVPDIATLSVEVSQEGADLDPALAQVRKNMARVLDVVKDQGVADKDVQTESFQVRPKYERDKSNNARRAGFVVSSRVSVKIRDLKKAGKVLSAVLNVGATAVDGPRFELDNRQAAESQALAAATHDAKGKAMAVAEAAGVTLGEILEINPQNINWPVSPRPYQMRGAMAASMADTQEPLSPGEQAIIGEVSVTYAIR